MTTNDWRDELYEANEQQWIVDRRKFNEQDIVHEYKNSLEIIVFVFNLLFNLVKVLMFV
jgi:hypothetical protein